MLGSTQIFISVFFGYFMSQFTKVIILFFKEKRFILKMIFRRGNMPSSHSATVSALLVSIFLVEGFSSLFVVTMIFSIIVIGDLLDMNIGIPKKERISQARTYIHKPSEVFIGILIGIAVAFIVMWIVSGSII